MTYDLEALRRFDHQVDHGHDEVIEGAIKEIERLRTIEARAWSAHGSMYNEAQAIEFTAKRLRERNRELHLALDPPVVK